MLRLTCLALASSVVAACGADRYRVETVGSARASAGRPASVPVAGGDALRVDLTVSLPRALLVRYAVACPGGSVTGELGESWEAYRARRIEELRRERERQVDAAGAVAGALLGRAGAAVQAEAPGRSAEVRAEVDGAAVGSAAARAALPEPALPPGDTGARVLRERLELGAGAGACTLHLSPTTPGEDLRGVTASMQVARLVDREREARERTERGRRIAARARGQVVASLAATGADPSRRARERAEREAAEHRERAAKAAARAEAEARAAAKARTRAEADLRARLERAAQRRLAREQALTTRGAVIAYFGQCGGDPHRRERERAEAERRRLEAEARALRAALTARERLAATFIALGADPEYRRKQNEADLAAFEARARARRDAEARRGSAEVEPPSAAVDTELDLPISIDGDITVRGAVWVPPVVIEIDGARVARPGSWRDRDGRRVRIRRRGE